jgi:stabilin-1
MLLGYANATQRGLEFMDFLEDELTYKTLFVPVNKGFVDNMVTAGPWAVCSSAVGPTQQVLLCS